MKKSLYQKIVTVPFIHSSLLGLLVSQILTQNLLADEFINVSDVKECRAIAAKAGRLLCYDTVADGGVFNEQQLQKVQKENFGSKDGQSDVSVDQLAVTIVSVTKSTTGIHYFHTADGAVWKQSNSGKWNLKVPFQAEIKAGMLGSFFLVTEGGKSVRVKRVR